MVAVKVVVIVEVEIVVVIVEGEIEAAIVDERIVVVQLLVLVVGTGAYVYETVEVFTSSRSKRRDRKIVAGVVCSISLCLEAV